MSRAGVVVLRAALPALLLPSVAAAEPYLRGVAQLSVGNGHVCTLTTAGEVACWGDNAAGQLGVGADGRTRGGQVTRPHVVGGLPRIAQVSAGAQHTCAVSVDGDVHCWGSAGGDRVDTAGGTSGSVELRGAALGTPVLMPIGKARAVHLSTHTHDACAVTADEVRCWNTVRAIPINARKVNAPTLRATKIAGATALAIGHGKVCAIAGGKMSCWSGGAPSAVAWGDAFTPVDVAIGESHACARSAAGEVRCWQSLIDDFWKRAPDRIVKWPGKLATRALAVGDSPICTADAAGTVDCFLADEAGLPDQAAAASWATQAMAPHPIRNVERAVALGLGRGRDAFGYGFGCALRGEADADGAQVYCWGDNEHGQLGNGATARSKRAVRVLGSDR
ncbi:MAG: hypothetical protein KIT31_32910 [Deltaproteobacteria bacterium]|nr:hypothetical protein [Deltaproteobacteria bacterium]